VALVEMPQFPKASTVIADVVFTAAALNAIYEFGRSFSRELPGLSVRFALRHKERKEEC